jgi:DNA-directed RNA polymerase subunit L
MKVKILKKNLNEMRLELEGEGHTFCNLLQKALLEDEAVEMASYNIPHPLVSSPIVYVRMKEKRKSEKKPETALKEAAIKIRHLTKEFRTSFEKALKEWQQT